MRSLTEIRVRRDVSFAAITVPAICEIILAATLAYERFLDPIVRRSAGRLRTARNCFGSRFPESSCPECAIWRKSRRVLIGIVSFYDMQMHRSLSPVLRDLPFPAVVAEPFTFVLRTVRVVFSSYRDVTINVCATIPSTNFPSSRTARSGILVFTFDYSRAKLRAEMLGKMQAIY